MDILALLNELQIIARTGLNYANNPYDEERYERILGLVSRYYGQTLAVPADDVQAHFRAELGQITPKVGADAAIFDDEGRILLVKRVDDGRWCLPCGWLDANESPAEGAVRETREETGLEVRPIQLVNVFSRKAGVDSSVYSFVAVVYFCEVVSGTPRISHESTDIGYWHIEDVPVWHGIHEDYARAAYQVWLKYQKPR